MKFLSNIIQISNCLSPNLADPCGVLSILEPSHQLFCQCSKLHSQLPISDDPSNACPKQETLVGEDAMNGLSVSLQVRLYSRKEDIQHECGYDLCSRHLSGYVHSQNRISVPRGPDSGAEDHPLEFHNGTWLPTLYGNSENLLNGNSFDNRPFLKIKTFIETKVTAMKLQGFNL